MSCSLKVYGRFRPSANGNQENAVELIGKHQAKANPDGKESKHYELHRIFSAECNQTELFDSVAANLVQECTEGINATIFAYGQTGSGKTHTMLGPSDSWSDPDAKGLIPRSIDSLFDNLEKRTLECQKLTTKVTAQFVELYNEEIFDLLSSKGKITLSDTGNEVHLVGAKTETVDTSLDLLNVVKTGWRSRSTGATAMNRDSSRSHAVLIVKICTEELTGDLRTTRTSTLNLVDLAGSERQSHTKATGERFKEAANINASLTVLGRCIRLLAKPSTAGNYIPYRDCNLTHILKNSLGGNSKTVVIVNMHPDKQFLAETMSTLQFAETCTLIKNKVRRNEVMSGTQEDSYKKAIQALRIEIEETRDKTREEFSKKLERHDAVCEENAALKTENLDLRAKYNLCLVKFSSSNNSEVSSRVEELLSMKSNGSSSDELFAKLETVTLELQAAEARCQKMQTERDDYRDRCTEQLNITFQRMTPNPKARRSSSRSVRRETLYCPSPARRAEFSEQNVDEVQEVQLLLEQAEMEIVRLKSSLEMVREEKVMAEARHDEEIAKLRTSLSRLEEDYSEVESHNNELVTKINSGRNDLEKLLNLISQKNQELGKLNSERRDCEEKWSHDMDEMQAHYESKLAALEKASADKTNSAIGDLETRLEDASARCDRLQSELAKKTSELERSKAESAKSLEELSILQSDQRHLKIRLQESEQNEQHLKKMMETLKENQQASFDRYQKDVAAARAKAQEEVQDRERSIDLLRNALNSQEKLSEKQKNDASKKFDEKISELKAAFSVQKKEAIEESLEEAKRQADGKNKEILAMKQEIETLQAHLESMQKLHTEDSALINNQLSNRHNRIGYVDKLRAQVVEQNAEIILLKGQLRKAEGSQRVLRSQNK